MLIISKKFKKYIEKEKLFGVDNYFISTDGMTKINDTSYLIGDIEYFIERGEKKKFRKPKDIDDILRRNNIYEELKNVDGSFFLIKIRKKNIQICADKFCKKDLFYYSKNGDFVVSDSLEYFFKFNLIEEYNQISLVSFFTLYGNYSPKSKTLFENIYRLSLNQYILLNKKGIRIIEKEFKPLNILEYNPQNLDEYYNILMDSVKFRSTENGINWVYLSSGWDSTAILAFLRELYPAEKVRGVIGEMVYSQRSGVINKYEIDRAKNIAKYYDIKLDVLQLNFLNPSITSYLENILPFMKYNSIYSFNTLNFSLLSDYFSKNSSGNDVVFSGEISDGVHNFGFSQYATVLEHPDLNFREYADKMASFLFSPSFLKSVFNNNYDNDLVYNYFKQRFGKSKFLNVLNKSKSKKNIELLSSFFLSPKRIPFYSMENLPMFSGTAINKYRSIYQKEYLSVLGSKMTPENIYSIIIYLYNLFHWQGSTVKVIGKSLERYNKSIKLPFWDFDIQRFLSQMPESWGRGLDLNKTKYPLKWVLENKTNYPIHLQTGPHSYLYDSNPRFSHLAEIVYGRKLNEYFKEKIDMKKTESILNDKYFNMNYIKRLLKYYSINREVSGQELIDTGSLILFSLIQ